MAFESPGFLDGTMTAGGNYSAEANRYTCARSTAVDVFTVNATRGVRVIGVLQETCSSGQPGAIMRQGVTKVRVTAATHTAINVGDKLIASTGGGVRASTSVFGTNYILGVARTAIGANTTGIITMAITHEGAGSTAAAQGSP